MTVGEIVYKILGDDSGLQKTLAGVGKTASTALSAANAVVGALAAGLSAASAGIGAIAEKAISGYADFEQLAGGVETLFKDSADTVRKYADEAFKNAGLSANEYMDTVTSFSASLISSLDGDTAAAAEAANTAIIDMSDNSAKMGTSIESIQNAYQGFAKQNFTMLDNLKIGYGGTKTEMERLLADAEKLQAANGIKVNYDIESFADITEAIHVVQTEMGITGTTAKEAATTISGSVSMMKSAWQNLMTGIADPTQDFDSLINNLVESIATVESNLMPRVQSILPQIASGITELAEDILPLIPEAIDSLLPAVISGAETLTSSLLTALSDIADIVVDLSPELMSAVLDLMDMLFDMITSGEAIDSIKESASEIIGMLSEALAENAGDVTTGAIDIIIALADGISDNLDVLVPAVIGAVLSIADSLLDNTDKILDAAEGIIVGLEEGLVQSIPLLVEAAPEIIVQLAAALISAALTIFIDVPIQICQVISDGIIGNDWGETASVSMNNLADAYDNAIENVADRLTKMGEHLYDLMHPEKPVDLSEFRGKNKEELAALVGETQSEIDSYRAALKELGDVGGDADQLSEGTRTMLTEWFGDENMYEAETLLRDHISLLVEDKQRILAAYQEIANAEAAGLQEVTDAEAAGLQDMAEADNKYISYTAEIEAQKGKAVAEALVRSANARAESLDEALEKIDKAYATHKISEGDYWAQRKATLEQHRNEESEEWWAYYDKVTDYYEKLADTETKAADQAAKKTESELKQSIEDKFRDLETEQLENGYDDSWLIEQERAFIETLDHNSEAYKDYNLKLLKEQQSANDKAKKQAEKSADDLKKSFDSLVKTRDSLADSFDLSTSSIFKSDSVTDKRTGATDKNNSLALDEFKKQLEAKKQLPAKIAALLDAGVSDSMAKDLLKLDPTDALEFANELLGSPSKLKDIVSSFQEDENISKRLANIFTENTEDFAALGADAEQTFGKSFMEQFAADWESSLSKIFSDEIVATISTDVLNANAAAASGNDITGTIGNRAAQAQNTAQNTTFAARNPGNNELRMRVVDVNGAYVAQLVNAENNSAAIQGGL